MKRLTLAKVCESLIDLISSDVIYALLFLIFFLLALYFMFSKNMKKKEKRIIKIIYGIILVCLIINYSSSFLSFLDYMMNKIFLVIYFPNLAAYVVMVLISTGIFLTSLFSRKMNTVVRNINIGVYLFIVYFLFLLGQVVMNKNINVYSDLAIYQNEEMMVLIEITMILFSLWIVGLGIYKFVKTLSRRKEVEKIKHDFKEESKKAQEEVLIDGFTKEEYRLLSQYLMEIKKKQEKCK